MLASAALAIAQDTIVQTDGQTRTGAIVGVAGDAVRIKVGPVETGIPLKNIASVKMAAPKAFDSALAAATAGKTADALAALTPLVTTFRGLPTPWAERASAMLGALLLDAGKVAEAEEAFGKFQAAYPDAGSLADVGLARLAIETKDFATAKAKIEPIVAEASKVIEAPSDKSAIYGQAYFVMGQIRENEGQLPEALRDYLTAVTLFYEDDAVVAKARARAVLLATEKNVIVP
jgi:predicted Zn-dependent protease